ncbi:MAG: ATP-binding protein [Planctomycetaceae bacterium]|nr:ATP-binding protein [Planctomycetaceae bacterium]
MASSTRDPLLILPENRQAWEAVLRLLDGVSGGLSPLVYLWGPAGGGKSHLLKQFEREARKRQPAVRIASLTASQLAADLADASVAGTVTEFREQFSGLDFFICEDLGALQKRHKTLQLLESIINETLKEGQGVLLSASRLPRELEALTPRLVSRCHAGVCTSIPLPEQESRVRLLQQFADTRQIPLTSSAAEYLATELALSPRELLAATLQLELLARRTSRTLVDEALARVYAGQEPGQPQPDLKQIARIVARHFTIRISDLRSTDRRHEHQLPRQCAMFLARELTDESLQTIAEYFGRRNHSTVVHSCRRTASQLDTDVELRHHLSQLRNQL